MKQLNNTGFFLIILLLVAPFAYGDMKQVQFESRDGLPITADLYLSNPETAPFILLFHQAGWSRGEYRETAPLLNKMGYNCMAIDQRSGREVNGVSNETARIAFKQKKGMTYLDAYIDLSAALHYVLKNYPKGKKILLGSSYSASLVLRLAAEHPDKIAAVLAFSPGEYFKKQKNATYIQSFASRIQCPVFITSSKNENHYWQVIYNKIGGKKASFLPESPGNHGSRALWAQFKDSVAYWQAVKGFLKTIK